MTPAVEHREQLEWEAHAGKRVAVAAFVSAILPLAAGIYLQSSFGNRPGNTVEFLREVEANDAVVVGTTGVASGLAALLLGVVLFYLYRATKYRRKQLPGMALVLGVAGPVLVAVLSVLVAVEQVNVARDFVSSGKTAQLRGLEDPGALKALAAGFENLRARDLIGEGNFATLQGIKRGADLAVAVAIILIALNAMRAGLLSRFMGIIGIVVGALLVIPIGPGPIIQFFWVAALGILFLGRWPGGRGPAWQTGEGTPWPGAAEQRAEVERRRAEREGTTGDGGDLEGPEDLEGDGDADLEEDESREAAHEPRQRRRSRSQAAKKRKRKRRR
jgi:hypothetical protein